MFYFYSEDIDFNLRNQSNIESLILYMVSFYNKNVGEVSIIFTSDSYLLNININSLNHDYYTDVITFDYCVDQIVSGDIFISIERVKENSLIFNKEFVNELLRVIIHGVLHLLGYGDYSISEKLLMTELENKFLSCELLKNFEL